MTASQLFSCASLQLPFPSHSSALCLFSCSTPSLSDLFLSSYSPSYVCVLSLVYLYPPSTLNFLSHCSLFFLLFWISAAVSPNSNPVDVSVFDLFYSSILSCLWSHHKTLSSCYQNASKIYVCACYIYWTLY